MKGWKTYRVLVLAVIIMAASGPCADLGAHADEEEIRTLTDKENNSGQWERMFTAISGKILTFEVIQDEDIVYAGTEDGLYRMSGPVYGWEKVDLPGGLSEVKDIVLNGENLLVVLKSGIYSVSPGAAGMEVVRRKDIDGITVSDKGGKNSDIFFWSGDEFFKVNGSSGERTGPGFLQGAIGDAACRGGNIFLGSGEDIYIISEENGDVKKIRVPDRRSGEATDEPFAEEEYEETADVSPVVKYIDTSGPGGTVVAARSGVFIVEDGCRELRDINTAGLPLSRLRCAADTEEGLFVSTDKKVFLLGRNDNRWRTFFDGFFPGDIVSIKRQRDAAGKGWFWIATDRCLYRKNMDIFSKKTAGQNAGMVRLREPSVREVQEMAVAYAEVSSEKIKKWRKGASWKAILPKLSVRFSEAVDDNIEIYTSATKSYVFEGPRERDNDWSVNLSWDLSDLIWNDAQTSIDVRSKLMVQLREDILEEVTRLYFERKRMLKELEDAREKGQKGIPDKQLRLEELTAYIDALTGGGFSRSFYGKD